METAPEKSQRQKSHIPWLLILIHTGAWIPFVVLTSQFFTDRLTVNPILAATQRTGDISITLIILSLACTPVHYFVRSSQVLKARRPLGLYGYLYAVIHLLIFMGADYRFNFPIIWEAVAKNQFDLIGLAAFIILSALALTSSQRCMARLKKNWKRLHRLVYLANILVVLHFGLAVKGDLLRLQGNISRPALAGVMVILLLAVRLPVVKKGIRLFIIHLTNRFAPLRKKSPVRSPRQTIDQTHLGGT